MSAQGITTHPFAQPVMLTYHAPDETTDAAGQVRVCEVDFKVRGISYSAAYRFDLNTGQLRINIAESVAMIDTAEFLGRLVQAIGERNAKAN
jgi:hypothetical protein